MTERSKTIPPRHQIASLVVLILDVIGLAALLFCATVIVPKFREIFADLLEGQSLPTLTQVLLSIPGPICFLCILATIAGLVWKELRVNDKSQTLIINLVALITVIVLFVIWVIALFGPLITIFASLQK